MGAKAPQSSTYEEDEQHCLLLCFREAWHARCDQFRVTIAFELRRQRECRSCQTSAKSVTVIIIIAANLVSTKLKFIFVHVC